MTKAPHRQILQSPESSSRLTKWAIELGEFDIEYKPPTVIKGLTVAEVLTELPNIN